MTESALYSGMVRHRRFSPKTNCFTYKVFMCWLDLDELETLFEKSAFWSLRKPNLVRFKRSDFFDGGDTPLKQVVQDWVHQQTGKPITGPVRMLANLRLFGYLINPIVCYYCYSDTGELEYVVAEVTNTPWNKRTHYLLPCGQNQSAAVAEDIFKGQFDKDMHVSPFHSMDIRYLWQLNNPGENLSLHFDNIEAEQKIFDATLQLTREPLTRASMANILWRYPLMTLKVFAAIYWQALKLFIKGLPLYGYPKSSYAKKNPYPEKQKTV